LYSNVREYSTAVDYAPYYLIGDEQADEHAVLQNEEASSRDAFFTALAAEPDALSESSRFLVHTHDPFVQEDIQEHYAVSEDESDPRTAHRSSNGASSAESISSNPPNNTANTNPQNLAGAYAGACQGPGGISTPNPSGGGSSGGGGGSANLHLPSPTQVTQMQQALSGATSQMAAVAPTVGSSSGTWSNGYDASAPSNTIFFHSGVGSGSGGSSGHGASVISSPLLLSSGSGGGGSGSGSGGLSWLNGSNAPNMPPGWNQDLDGTLAITPPSNQVNNEGDNVSLQIQASMPYDNDPQDNETLNYAALGLPPGLSINSSTGLISGTIQSGAAAEFGGTYNPTIIVSDAEGNSRATGLTWTVNPAPAAPPVFTSPSNQSNIRGDSVSLQVNASQVDGDAVSYYASNLPPGLSIDSNTGLISGTIGGSATLGVPYAVTLTTVDSVTNLYTSQTFNWTINATNVAPALTSPGNQSNSAGDDVSLQLSATDADGDNLTYTATGLPPGLSLDPITGTITGTLPNSAASSTPYNVTVTASDGMASSSQSFTWTVNAVSLQNPGDQSNLDGDSVSLQLTASDANNATLTYSASNLPPGLSIDSDTGLISGTIASNADTNSPYSVTLTATDSNNDSVSQSFNWSVAVLALNPVSDQESQEDAAVSLQLSATDNAGTPTYSTTGLPPGLSISSGGLISGTIGIGSYGSSPYQVTVTATDGSATSSQSFVWTVTPRVALVNPGDQSNAEGDAVSLQLSATSPGGTMSYSANGLPSGLPPGLSLNTTTGLISGTITAGDAANGPYTVDVSIANGTVSTSQTFTWTINPVVDLTAPADQNNNEGDNVSLQMSATDSLNNPLTYTADGLPSGLSINSSTGLISGTLSSGDAANSPYVVMVTASDGTYSSSVLFSWTVTHTDTTALTMTNPSTQVNVAGDSVNLQINASDPDGSDFLTYSATGLPDGLAINPYNGLISGIVADDAVTAMPYTVTVTADDGNGQSVSQTFAMMVNASALVATASPINAVEGNDTGSITVATFTTPDLNAQAGDFLVTIDWGDGSMLDYGAVTGSDGSFTVTGDNTYTEYGSYTVTITITDTVTGASTTVTTTATVTDAPLTLIGGFQLGESVNDVGPVPYAVAALIDGNPDAGPSDFTVNLNGTLIPADNVEAEGDGRFLILDSNGYSMPFPDTQPQSYTINIGVTDDDGASASTSSTVVVGNIISDDAGTMGDWMFQDSNPNATASDFTAEVQWGDGTTSPGTISPSGPDFVISANLNPDYAKDSLNQSNGIYQITVTVTGDGGTLTDVQYMSVDRPPLQLYTEDVATQPNSLSLSNVALASITVPDTYDVASEFSATINWGDQSSSDGVIEEVAPGLFVITGSHAYASAGGVSR
jgi:hypothetical protein